MHYFVQSPGWTFKFCKNVLFIHSFFFIHSFLKSINCVSNVVLWTRDTMVNKPLSLFSRSFQSSRSESVWERNSHQSDKCRSRTVYQLQHHTIQNRLYNRVWLKFITVMVFTMHTQWFHLCYLISSSINPSQENILLRKKPWTDYQLYSFQVYAKEHLEFHRK